MSRKDRRNEGRRGRKRRGEIVLWEGGESGNVVLMTKRRKEKDEELEDI